MEAVHHRAEIPRKAIDWREVTHTVCTEVDWEQIARLAFDTDPFGLLVAGCIRLFGALIDSPTQPQEPADSADAAVDAREPDPDPPPPVDTDSTDPAARDAALLLGVDLDATADEIRAALRARLADSRLHPDHGGDGEEAKRLIAARNLLVERARARDGRIDVPCNG